MISINGSFKIVFLKYQKQVLIKYTRNWEYASLIEVINIIGQ